MAFGVSAAAFAEFSARPYIQHAIKNPYSPRSVLSFFYGIDFDNEQEKMAETSTVIREMEPFWYAGGEDYDKLTIYFAPLVRLCGKSMLPEDPWDTTMEGQMAKVILCDQMSRNAFRGDKEVFLYDDVGLAAAKRVYVSTDIHNLMKENYDEFEMGVEPLNGTLYTAYFSTIVTAIMHSEDYTHHEMARRVLGWVRQETDEEDTDLLSVWDNQESFLKEHTAVAKKFGRYPHRNRLLQRVSSEKEAEWLADKASLPAWAKSQG